MLRGINLARWTARILATGLLLFVMVFVVAEGLPRPSSLTTREQLMFGGLFAMLLGTLVGWKREAWGGILMVAGFLFLCVVDNLATRSFRGGVWVAFAPFGLTGLLYLLVARAAQISPAPTSQEPGG